MKKIWMLKLVGNGRHHRWIFASVSFVVLFCLLFGIGFERSNRDFSWPVMLFFCVILAYIVPIFHFITQRTEEALDELSPFLNLEAVRFTQLRQAISHRSIGWMLLNASIGIGCWFVQSMAMLGGVRPMYESITNGVSGFIFAIMPLLVWLGMMCAIHALIDNARLFRSLAQSIEIDLLDPEKLTPFGRMSVASTLVVIGAQASFSIMWLGGEVSLWSTIPGIIPTTAAIIYLLIAPVWPIHKKLRAQKVQEIERVQGRINQMAAERKSSLEHLAENLSPLLAYRREISRTSEWPFNLSVLARLGLYIIIVPLTWIGAALIENVVDVFIT